jgi:hypothetical protein
MAGFTNRGKYRLLDWLFRGGTLPTNFYAALVTDAVAPAADINTFSQLTEIAAGNGYTSGGMSLTPGETDFDTHTEDDDNDEAFVVLKDLTWTADGGPIPASGDGARYIVLLDDNVVVADREVLAWADLGGDVTVSDTQTITSTAWTFGLAEAS